MGSRGSRAAHAMSTKPRPRRNRRRRRPWLLGGLAGLAVLTSLALALATYANLAPAWVSRGRLFDDPAALPQLRFALVFGTTDRVNGRENHYFRFRIDAAEQLWKSCKIDTIIVSGDKSSKYYDEPEKMKQALIERGVPADRILCDDRGLRTLFSVQRVKQHFGVDRVVFVSQRFQNERAIYLARASGIDAVGFNARDVTTQKGLKTRVREVGARVLMWFDVHILGTHPDFKDQPIELPPPLDRRAQS